MEAYPMTAGISPGALLAWQIAADRAFNNNSDEIQPIHLFSAILSLPRAIKREGKSESLSASNADQRDTEIRALDLKLHDAQIDVEALLAILEQPRENPVIRRSECSGRISRSAETHSIFQRARIASKGEDIQLFLLFQAVCTSGNQQVETVLARAGADGAALRSLVESFEFNSRPEFSDSDDHSNDADLTAITIVEEIDAVSRVQLSKQDSGRDRFAELCEATWESGTAGSTESMLQNVLNGLMHAVPVAEHGAVLTFDNLRNEWMLKAHTTGTTPALSMSSAKKAFDTRKGFIWKRGDHLSHSQVVAGLAAGLYAPLIADDEAVGVICLDSFSGAKEFTTADLRLVTALAHQLGLVIAHRELRRNLTANITVLERLLTTFSPQVRNRLVQRARMGKLELGGQIANVTVLFVDLRGFTSVAASLAPDKVAEMLNQYFSALTECAFRHDGSINDFVGDALVAVFGSPEEDPRHSRKAVAAAASMQAAVNKVKSRRRSRGEVACEIGIGVHCGDVVHGFIGSIDCMQYTVVGNVVNLAARYSSAAQGGQILISPQVHERVWSEVRARKVTVPTKHEGALMAYLVESTSFE
jgi:class 3 adenylate cyclase